MPHFRFPRTKPAFYSLLLAGVLLGSLTYFSAALAEIPIIAQDDVYGGNSIFDPNLNLVADKGRLEENYQRPETGTHFFLNAYDLFRVSEAQKDKYWNVRPPVWPLWHKGIIGMAGPSENIDRMALQTPDPIFPKVSGPHRLWIRWVRWKNLPAPLNVKISQDGKLVAEQQIGRDVSDNLDPYQAVIVWDPIDCELVEGNPVSVVFEKFPDRRLAGDRIIDAIYLTSNLTYRPVGRTQLPQIEELESWKKGLKAPSPLALWPADSVWNSFGIHDRPEPWNIKGSGAITACRNEIEQMLLRITSLSPKPASYTVTATPLTNAAGETFTTPEVRVATQIQSRRYGWVPAALLRRQNVQLEPFHTTGLWTKVDTHGVPAGSYTTTLSLEGSGTVVKFPITVTVRSLSLDPRSDFWVTVWTEPKEMPAPAELDIYRLMLQDLADHRVNFMQFLNWDEKYAADFQKAGFVAGWKPTEPWAFFQDREAPWQGEPDIPKLKEMLQEVRRYQKAIGFSDKPFVTQFGDEFPLNEHWVQLIGASKKLDPTLKVLMTTYLIDNHDVEIMKGLTDYWMATPDVYRGSSLIETMNRVGATPLLYSPLFYDGMDSTTSWMRLRRMGWFSLDKGIKGMGFYCYNGYNGDPWQDGTGDRYDKSPVQEAAVFPGTLGPVPSPSWESWRESAEDVSLLLQLRERMDDPQTSPEEKESLSLLWRHSMHQINNIETATTFDSVKARIIDALEKTQP